MIAFLLPAKTTFVFYFFSFLISHFSFLINPLPSPFHPFPSCAITSGT